MKNKQNNTPTLRFPPFTEGWVKKKLGEVAEFKVTNSFSRDNLNYKNGVVKNIHYGDIHTKFQTAFDITKEIVPFINEKMNVNRIAEDFYCKEGDIVFADASEDLNDVGKSIEIINLNNEKLLSGLHTLLARPKENYFSIGFNGFLFKSNSIKLQIQREAQGTKVLSINVGRISNVEISFPTLPEQQKIATFFTAIDKKLQQLKEKKRLLETYKKGVMQQLFSQALRFKNKEGGEFEEWEVKKLGEVAIEVKRNLKDKSDFSNIEVLTISAERGFISQKERFSQVIAGNSLSKYTLLSKGEMSYNKGASKRFQFGCFYTLQTFDKALVPNVYISFAFDDNCNSEFYNFLFSTGYANSLLRQYISSSVRLDGLLNINRNDFFSIEIPVPFLAEQTQIANYLSAIDEKIKNTEGVIKQMEQWKKGLLQQMFV